MKSLKKITLSNLNDSQIEKSQLNKLNGGVAAPGNPCYNGCQGCIGAGNAVDRGIAAYRKPRPTLQQK